MFLKPLIGFTTSTSLSTTLVDAPFQKPAERGLTEVEVTDPGHPLFGRRFAVVSVSGPRPPGRAGGHILVAHSSRVLLKLPLAATSLVPRPPDAGLSKLSAEAVAELIALAEDSEGVTMLVRPERVWHRTPEALRREIAEDVAALLAEVIHENGTDRRPPPRTARGDLHPPVHATPGADQPGEPAPAV
jgi:hypothetical protein